MWQVEPIDVSWWCGAVLYVSLVQNEIGRLFFLQHAMSEFSLQTQINSRNSSLEFVIILIFVVQSTVRFAFSSWRLSDSSFGAMVAMFFPMSTNLMEDFWPLDLLDPSWKMWKQSILLRLTPACWPSRIVAQTSTRLFRNVDFFAPVGGQDLAEVESQPVPSSSVSCKMINLEREKDL